MSNESGLEEKQKARKSYIKSLCTRSEKKRKEILKSSSKQNLRILQSILIALVNEDIGITPRGHIALQKSKKIRFIRKEFARFKHLSHPNLLKLLLKIEKVLPTILLHMRSIKK